MSLNRIECRLPCDTIGRIGSPVANDFEPTKAPLPQVSTRNLSLRQGARRSKLAAFRHKAYASAILTTVNFTGLTLDRDPDDRRETLLTA